MEERKFIVSHYRDQDTGFEFCEDIRGNIHYLGYRPSNSSSNDSENIYKNSELIVLQTMIRGFNWSSDTSFNRVKNSFIQGNFIDFNVPLNKELHIVKLIASQKRRGGDDNNLGLSYVGLFVNGNLLLTLPLLDNLNPQFDSPIILPKSSFLEIKFLPFDKKIDLGLTIISYTVGD